MSANLSIYSSVSNFPFRSMTFVSIIKMEIINHTENSCIGTVVIWFHEKKCFGTSFHWINFHFDEIFFGIPRIHFFFSSVQIECTEQTEHTILGKRINAGVIHLHCIVWMCILGKTAVNGYMLPLDIFSINRSKFVLYSVVPTGERERETHKESSVRKGSKSKCLVKLNASKRSI